MRKKILAIVFAALLTLAMAVPAFANEHGDQDGDANDNFNPGQETLAEDTEGDD